MTRPDEGGEGGVEADVVVYEEEPQDHSHGPQHAAQHLGVCDRLGFVQVENPVLVPGEMQLSAEQDQQYDHGAEPNGHHGRDHVDQEGVEVESRGAADHDVWRVAHQGRHAANVGEHGLGHQVGRRIEPEHAGDQHGEWGKDDHRGHVVQEHRQHADRQGKIDEEPPGRGRRQLGEPDRQVLEAPGGPQQGHQEHHAEQQQHGVRVDRRNGLLLGIEADHLADPHHDHGAEQGRAGTVQTLREDQGVGGHQYGGGDQHRGVEHHAFIPPLVRGLPPLSP